MAISNKIPEINIDATHIVFISDIHFGVRKNNEEWQNNLSVYFRNFFIPYLREVKKTLKDGERLVCFNLGDTFNDRTAIDINVENLAIEIFEEIAHEVDLYALYGNHDLSKKTNKGNSSLRSIGLIPNIHIIKDVTMIDVHYGNSTKHMKFLAIPFLGDKTLETEYLSKYSRNATYALMHTELTNMKMANGSLITDGANADMFKGRILSGHIHKRQETDHCIYIGTPYQLDRADIGDIKGLYLLDVASNTLSFTENRISPVYQNISMDKLIEMDESERKAYLDNNYTNVLIEEEKLAGYLKKYDIYNLGLGTTAKLVAPVINKKKYQIGVEDGVEYRELSIGELLISSINEMTDIDEAMKSRLRTMCNNYLSEASREILSD